MDIDVSEENVPPLLSAVELSHSFSLEFTTQNAMSFSVQTARYLQSPFNVYKNFNESTN